jgi:hypothetical protein
MGVTIVPFKSFAQLPSTVPLVGAVDFQVGGIMASVFINEIPLRQRGRRQRGGDRARRHRRHQHRGWRLVLYNGNGGVLYSTIDLSGRCCPDQQSGFGTLSFAGDRLAETDRPTGSPWSTEQHRRPVPQLRGIVQPPRRPPRA